MSTTPQVMMKEKISSVNKSRANTLNVKLTSRYVQTKSEKSLQWMNVDAHVRM